MKKMECENCKWFYPYKPLPRSKSGKHPRGGICAVMPEHLEVSHSHGCGQFSENKKEK